MRSPICFSCTTRTMSSWLVLFTTTVLISHRLQSLKSESPSSSFATPTTTWRWRIVRTVEPFSFFWNRKVWPSFRCLSSSFVVRVRWNPSGMESEISSPSLQQHSAGSVDRSVGRLIVRSFKLEWPLNSPTLERVLTSAYLTKSKGSSSTP